MDNEESLLSDRGRGSAWSIINISWVIWALPLLVHFGTACIRLHFFLTYTAQNPHPITSLTQGGGCNAVWCAENRILYQPVCDGDHRLQGGVYATDSRGRRPYVILHGSEWFLECCNEFGDLYLLKENDRRFYWCQRGKRQPTAIDVGLPIRNIAVSARGQLALVIERPRGVYNMAIASNILAQPRYVTHFTTARECVDFLIPVQWSPDGSAVIFAKRNLGKNKGVDNHRNRQFLTLDVHSGKMCKYSLPGDTSGFAICPTDGSTVAYACNEKLFVKSGARKPQIVARNYSCGGHRSIDWSPDGKQIVYDGSDGNLWLVASPQKTPNNRRSQESVQLCHLRRLSRCGKTGHDWTPDLDRVLSIGCDFSRDYK